LFKLATLLVQVMASWNDWEDGEEQDLDADDPYMLGQIDSGSEFFELLVELKMSALPLSAKQCCILSWWASRAGARGQAGDLALHPNSKGGNFSKRFDKHVGVASTSTYYDVPVPGHRRCSASRSVDQIPTRPPHEGLSEEFEHVGADKMHQLLIEADRDNRLPPCYYDHAVVKENPPNTVYPVIVYVDAVPFTRTDGAIGFYLYSLLTGVRILCAVLRKIELCECGCKGWCSLYQIFLMLFWSFKAMRYGRWPNARHDHGQFRCDSDEHRIAKQGTALNHKACLVLVKADGAEYVNTFGFPSWASNEEGCPCCSSPLTEFYDIAQINYFNWPWRRHDANAYNIACASCELSREITETTWRQLRASLHYDKRKKHDASRGRCLAVPLPELNLLAGDRLEPTPTHPDSGDGFDLLAWPQTFIFWRRSGETSTRHRNPLYSDEIGTSPDRTNSFDWLHCLSWGVFKDFLSWFVHELWAHNVYRVEGSGDTIILGSAHLLKRDLFEWYISEKSLGHVHTEVQDLTPSMFGTYAKPKLGLFASETNGFLLFAETLLDKFEHQLDHVQRIRTCLKQLIRCYRVIKLHPCVFHQKSAKIFWTVLRSTSRKPKFLAYTLSRSIIFS
jgi:hypothetical protein